MTTVFDSRLGRFVAAVALLVLLGCFTALAQEQGKETKDDSADTTKQQAGPIPPDKYYELLLERQTLTIESYKQVLTILDTYKNDPKSATRELKKQEAERDKKRRENAHRARAQRIDEHVGYEPPQPAAQGALSPRRREFVQCGEVTGRDRAPAGRVKVDIVVGLSDGDGENEDESYEDNGRAQAPPKVPEPFGGFPLRVGSALNKGFSHPTLSFPFAPAAPPRLRLRARRPRAPPPPVA